MVKKNKQFDIFPGDLPVKKIYDTLGIELGPGKVKFSAPAQRHAYKYHSKDVPVIIPHLSMIVENPMYMGDDLNNLDKIEFVGRIRGLSGGALVAIAIEKNNDGYYHICSAYLLTDSEVDKKRSNQILKFVK